MHAPASRPHGKISERGWIAAESASNLHPRLLAAQALVGWLPNLVGNRLRTRALRAAGIKLGEGTTFFGYPTLIGPGPIHERLIVGGACGFNKGALFDLTAEIRIGDHVSVGHDVSFITGTYAPGDASRRAGDARSAPIAVHDGVWIGARATILAGVTIGAGSVISAGVAVGEDVPENTLVTGNQRVSLARWRP
ncbi:MAG TPA: DapH/DapD/GlmU-related protein [Polyangiaceae bacterium]|nr:DapH/DapD/GlmU-related protein [Polyangiaceae bacterium]